MLCKIVLTLNSVDVILNVGIHLKDSEHWFWVVLICSCFHTFSCKNSKFNCVIFTFENVTKAVHRSCLGAGVYQNEAFHRQMFWNSARSHS